jgi:ketosteroid isomerase-like protein
MRHSDARYKPRAFSELRTPLYKDTRKKENSMTPEQQKSIIRGIYNRLEIGDAAGFAEHVAVNYVWRFPSKASWSKRFEGRKQVREELLGPLFNLFSGPYTAKILRLISEDDIVVAEIEGHAVLKTGNVYDNQYCMLFRFRDDKIVEVIEYCDTDLEERVLGPHEQALANFQKPIAT